MYSYNDLIKKLNIENNNVNRFVLKAIINSLLNNRKAFIDKQKINVDINKVEYLWDIYINLSTFFDYKYNNKNDLIKFFSYIINGEDIIFNAVFCPGYTDNGYKDYVGNNNTKRIYILNNLKEKLIKEKLNVVFKISLVDIFLENTNFLENKNWENELMIHTKKFIERANECFDDDEIIIFSDVFSEKTYQKGFIDSDLLCGKNYENFYKNNLSFYKKMNWSLDEIKNRNDKLYTIYTIISKYINQQNNGIYLPMETMYSRSKVMSYNKVCTMYLHK